MNQRSDIDRLLRHWMDDGPTRMPDRIVDVVADRISVQRQGRSWRLLRRLPMNSLLKVGAAAAAVLVLAIVGYNLLPGRSGPGAGPRPTPSATATPSMSPAGSPVATGPVALPEGVLPGGAYQIQPFIPGPLTLSVAADIPSGWVGVPSVPAVVRPDENTGILIAGMAPDGLFSDPCQWDLDGTGSIDQAGDVVVGPTVDDLVNALKANTSYTSSVVTPLTIGGYEGQELELQLPGDDVISACDRRQGQSTGDFFVFPGGFYALSPDSRWDLFVVDVDGIRLVILVSIAPGTPQADITAARAIVESFQITP